MSDDQAQAPRDYGGWRLRRGIGLFGFGMGGTIAMLAALLVLIITAAASPAALLYVAPPLLAGGGIGLARAGGEPLALAALRRARWRYASSRDWTRYRVAVVAEHSPAWRLPGVLAPLALLDAEDGYGGRYALVLDRRTGMMTATLRVIPASTWLADRADADTWVANWGGWLASLGYLPAVRWVTVTIDTAPEPGSTLADSVAARARPGRAADRPADHGPARGRRPGRRRRRGHPGQHHLRPGRRTIGARRADRCRRRGRPDAARAGVGAGHLRGHRAGPGHPGRDRRRGPHRL